MEMEGKTRQKDTNQITGIKKERGGDAKSILLASLGRINLINASGHEQGTGELESALCPLKGLNFLNC